MSIVPGLCLLLAGCTWREVNEQLVFPYERRDGTVEVVAKSAGNAVVMPLVLAGVVTVGAVYVGGAALVGIAQSGGMSGSIGRDGVKIHR